MCTRRCTSGAATSLCEFPNKTTHVLYSDRREWLIALWGKYTDHWYSLLCVLFTWRSGYPNRDCWTIIAPPVLGFLKGLQCENCRDQSSPQGTMFQPGRSLFLASQRFLEWSEFPLPRWSSFTMPKIIRPCCDILSNAQILAQHTLCNTALQTKTQASISKNFLF